jgi:hypothetical protein
MFYPPGGKAQMGISIENVCVIRRMNIGMVGKKSQSTSLLLSLSCFGLGLLLPPVTGPAFFGNLIAAAQSQSVRRHVFCDS